MALIEAEVERRVQERLRFHALSEFCREHGIKDPLEWGGESFSGFNDGLRDVLNALVKRKG
jgi:hypothetical protein